MLILIPLRHLCQSSYCFRQLKKTPVLILNQLDPMGVFASTPALSREIITAGFISQYISLSYLNISHFISIYLIISLYFKNDRRAVDDDDDDKSVDDDDDDNMRLVPPVPEVTICTDLQNFPQSTPFKPLLR